LVTLLGGSGVLPGVLELGCAPGQVVWVVVHHGMPKVDSHGVLRSCKAGVLGCLALSRTRPCAEPLGIVYPLHLQVSRLHQALCQWVHPVNGARQAAEHGGVPPAGVLRPQEG